MSAASAASANQAAGRKAGTVAGNANAVAKLSLACFFACVCWCMLASSASTSSVWYAEYEELTVAAGSISAGLGANLYRFCIGDYSDSTWNVFTYGTCWAFGSSSVTVPAQPKAGLSQHSAQSGYDAMNSGSYATLILLGWGIFFSIVFAICTILMAIGVGSCSSKGALRMTQVFGALMCLFPFIAVWVFLGAVVNASQDLSVTTVGGGSVTVFPTSGIAYGYYVVWGAIMMAFISCVLGLFTFPHELRPAPVPQFQGQVYGAGGFMTVQVGTVGAPVSYGPAGQYGPGVQYAPGGQYAPASTAQLQATYAPYAPSETARKNSVTGGSPAAAAGAGSFTNVAAVASASASPSNPQSSPAAAPAPAI